ncbi:MAG: c-type cytochrome [Bacteroidota bacterium]|nr:c-type cytochrome [Bacteroidota bacterium]
MMYSARSLTIVCVLIMAAGQSCKLAEKKNDKSDSLALRQNIPPSPVLSPEESLKKMHVVNGFTVKLVAAEPLVTAPVALNFDEQGRIWVLEMQDFMPDTLGTGEDKPSGKIVILSDRDGDGVMDERKVFLDSLVLPRALCLIENGILVAEPPKLWYYEIQNDKPVKKTLVDSAYAEGGNVEHQPNGLFRDLDNWIYNAKSAKRYRKMGDHWLVEKTHFRGQWGISADDQGRLYYNSNEVNLEGDFFSPGLGATNKHQQEVAGYDERIVRDNRVYPARPTPGVNRGYMEGILDDSLRLVNFTAACSPLIYTSTLFGKAFYGNAFVAEPAGNLIKRDILIDHGYSTNGEEAYVKEEFLASEDERFRPVSLYNAPGGALYIVDMYRGILQHKTYLTPYLKSEIRKRELTKPLSCGRIYKVVPLDAKEETIHFTEDNSQLVELLKNPNGWVRNKAQQLLVDRKDKRVAPALRDLLRNTENPLSVIHALWTMEGLAVLRSADLLPLLKQNDWTIRMQALTVLPSVVDRGNYRQFLQVLLEMINNNDTLAAPYISYLAHSFESLNPAATQQLLLTLAKKYPGNRYVADGIISNLENRESDFYKEALSLSADSSILINKRLKKLMADIAEAKNNSNLKALAEEFPKGFALFHAVCQTCHGVDGNGVNGLAPPLNSSNWVQGDKDKLISIVLYGLSGPIKVAGKEYKAPQVSGEMPGIGTNKDFSDEDIAQVLSFIRGSWSNRAGKIKAGDVVNIRKILKDRQKSFTEEELNKSK